MKATSRIIHDGMILLTALTLGGCLLNDGKDLIPKEGTAKTPNDILVGTGTLPQYSWTVGPVAQLTVVRTDSPNSAIWSLTSVTDIIASPVTHGDNTVPGTAPQGSTAPLINGVEYRVNIQNTKGQSYSSTFKVPVGNASLTSAATRLTLQHTTLQPVTAASGHTLMTVPNGTVQGFGANDHGQLGNGTATDERTPAMVAGLTDVVAVAAGHEHSLALTTDGSVWAWGANGYGQLGNGTTFDSAAPVKLTGLGEIVAIAAGARHSLALTTDGAVWAWGDNSSGQLGTGMPNGNLNPVRIPGLTGVRSISAGDDYSTAVTQDGAVWTWGANGHGQLGTGDTAPTKVPVRAITVPGA